MSSPQPINEKDSYRHRHIDIDIPNTNTNTNVQRKKERRIYIPIEFEDTFLKLEQLLRIEGSNLSHWSRQNAVEYVRLHEPGNPQKPLTVFTGQVKVADPFGCGMFNGIDSLNRWVNCLFGRKMPRTFCETQCLRRKKQC